MVRITPLFPLLPLFLACFACGGSNRHLQSIGISPTSGGGPTASFQATGTYNVPPMNATPVPVSWFLLPEVDPPPPTYSLSNASFVPRRCPEVVNSPGSSAGSYTVVALAPTNPAAPLNGTVPPQVMTDLVYNRTATSEDGFVAATAKLTCQ
jgi:hypothetical protein